MSAIGQAKADPRLHPEREGSGGSTARNRQTGMSGLPSWCIIQTKKDAPVARDVLRCWCLRTPQAPGLDGLIFRVSACPFENRQAQSEIQEGLHHVAHAAHATHAAAHAAARSILLLRDLGD